MSAEYEIDYNDVLGKGGYATVFKAKHVTTKEFAAAKQLTPKTRRDTKRIQEEIRSVKNICHHNLVQYLFHFEEEGVVWVFFEFCDLGDLEKYFVNKHPDEEEIILLMQQIATAVKFLHGEKIVHRDVKPGNILVKSGLMDELPLIKIADFGTAKVVEKPDSSRLSFSTIWIGTRGFMAPELFCDDDTRVDKSDKSVDIFALGLTFFSMICFKRGASQLIPSEDPSNIKEIGHEMSEMQKEGELKRAKLYHEEVVEIKGMENECKIRKLIQKMILFESKERVKAPEILDHLNEILNVKIVQDFELIQSKKFGEIGFGIVCWAKHAHTGEFLSAKQINDMYTDNTLIERQIENMKSLNHPNFTKVLNHLKNSDNDDDWLFLEFCNFGDLNHYFTRHSPGRRLMQNMMKQTVSAVKFLHASGLVHGNIKPQNILIQSLQKDVLPVVKIFYFGFTNAASDSDESLFTAPERYDSDVKPDQSVDIFSLGLVFIAMICFNIEHSKLIPSEDASSPPNIGKNMFELHKSGQMEACNEHHKDQVPVKGDLFEKNTRQLVRDMIVFEKTKRLSIDKVAEDLEVLFSAGASHLESFDSQKLQNQMSLATVIKNFWHQEIQAVRSDSQQLTCVAQVVGYSWNETTLELKVWDLTDSETQSWSQRDITVNHTLNLVNPPAWSQIITILDNMMLVRVALDEKWTSQVVAIDLQSGYVLHKSHVYPGCGVPEYCCFKSQVMLQDKRSSSITQLDAETLRHLNTWTDERVTPWRVCNNKSRAAIKHDFDESIFVFKWECQNLSNELMYKVELNSSGMHLLQNNTLIGINSNAEWSVWNDSGAPVHTTVLAPPLVSGMKMYTTLRPDPETGECFVYEYGQLVDNDDDSWCIVIYNSRIILNRLESGGRTTQIDKSQLKLNETFNIK